MRPGATLLALDLATEFGWAEGPIGGTPRSGTERFAPKGASRQAVFAEAIRWAADRFALSKPKVVFIEVPDLYSIAKGRSSREVIRILLGLPAIIEGVAYRRGIYDVRTASASDVRQLFLGRRNLPGEQAKRLTRERCRLLGWDFSDHNAADALAVWAYGCEVVQPGSLPNVMPLFTGASEKWSKPKGKRA